MSRLTTQSVLVVLVTFVVFFVTVAGAAAEAAGPQAARRHVTASGHGGDAASLPMAGVNGEVAPPSDADLHLVLRSGQRRVRLLPPRLGVLAVEGARRSPTFGRLLLALQRGDVIVHVTRASSLPLGVAARTLLASSIGDFRFVRIQLGDRRMGDDLIAVLGHELFHALEISEASDARSRGGVDLLYRRIGFRGTGASELDTDAARAVEHRIRTELAERRR